MKRCYAVYDKKTEELLALGDAKFCTTMMHLASVKSFYSLVSNVKRGKNQKYEVIVDEEEDCEE